jgi:hypothetical protein
MKAAPLIATATVIAMGLGAPAARAGKQEPAPAKSTKVKCYRCQHRQVVPLSQSTFVCEQCGET